jgi:hypothetical protein
MMQRIVYSSLVWLHPPAFRREFGPEMLWIFDECAAAGATGPLYADALASLARQWLIGMGTWKVAAAAVGGMLYISTILSALAPAGR